MGFRTEHLQIDNSLNVDGSIFQYNVEFTGSGGGGGTGDVAWADGNYGNNNYMMYAAGDGSIVANVGITWAGGNLYQNNGDIVLRYGNDLRLWANIDSSDCGDIVFLRNDGSNEFSRIWADRVDGKLYYRYEADSLISRLIYHSGNLITNNTNNRIVTASGSLENPLNGEGNLTFDGTSVNITGTLTTTSDVSVNGDLFAGGGDTKISSSNIELNRYGTGNRYAYIDFHGDDTYSDYGLRIIRNNTGSNTSSEITHRGTGELRITCPEGGNLIVNTGAVFNEDSNDVDFRVESNGDPYNFVSDGGTDRIVIGTTATNVTSKFNVYRNTNPYYQSGFDASLGGFQIETRHPTASDGNASGIKFVIGSGSIQTGTAAIFAERTAGWGAGRLHFAVNNSGSSGKPDIPIFHLIDGVNSRASWYNSSATEEIRFNLTNGQIDANGDVVAYSTLVSDVRLKENIKPIGNSLDKILALQGVSYNRKSNGNSHIGYIAQEVEKIIPEVIVEKPLPLETGDEETLYKTLRYVEILPYITEAMKEQQQIINDQKKEIDDLKQKIEAVLEKINI